MYVDSSLVRANVSTGRLSPSSMSVEENGLFVLQEREVDENGEVLESVSCYQDPKGRLPLSPVDTDARRRTSRYDKHPNLYYQENAIVDGGGFILSRNVTHAIVGE